METDWRLTNQMNYLYKAGLIKSIFKKSSNNDHEHCEFCWSKFGEEDNTLHVGYCTIDKRVWICKQCYNDFKEQFDWHLISQEIK